jgi:hypothetical protein
VISCCWRTSQRGRQPNRHSSRRRSQTVLLSLPCPFLPTPFVSSPQMVIAQGKRGSRRKREAEEQGHPVYSTWLWSIRYGRWKKPKLPLRNSWISGCPMTAPPPHNGLWFDHARSSLHVCFFSIATHIQPTAKTFAQCHSRRPWRGDLATGTVDATVGGAR